MKLTLEIEGSDDSTKTLFELISLSREIIKKKLKQITIYDDSFGLLQPVQIKEFNCSGEIKIKIDL
jgi:hypothetical protein